MSSDSWSNTLSVLLQFSFFSGKRYTTSIRRKIWHAALVLFLLNTGHMNKGCLPLHRTQGFGSRSDAVDEKLIVVFGLLLVAALEFSLIFDVLNIRS